MSIIVESSQSTFKPVPAGMHLARLYRIIDLGTQENKFEGKVTGYIRKVKFVWEVHGKDEDDKPLVTDDGKPMAVSRDYTLSWGDKANLRKDLQAWRGKPFEEHELRRFDLKSVLDKWCMLDIQHKPREKGGVYDNVVGIRPVPSAIRSMGLPQGFNRCEMFTISDPDMEMFETFGKYLKATIEQSPEWKARQPVSYSQNKSSGFDDMKDDLPPF